MKKSVNYLLVLMVLLSIVSCAKSEKVSGEKENEVNNEVNVKMDAAYYASLLDYKNIDANLFLDYKKAIEEKVYKWVLSDDKTYYTLTYVDKDGNVVKAEEKSINVGANNEERKDGEMPKDALDGKMPGGMKGMMEKNNNILRGTYINANISNIENQTMLIYVPAEYFDVDDNDEVIGINYENMIGNYTAKTAPIIFLNECGGWRSSSPRACELSYIDQGYIYVTCGARSRDAMIEERNWHSGKAPMPVVDLKSGVIILRANDEVIPGDKNKIISIGTSGGGQMSSILGASGDMSAYYPYMYETGTLGVTKNADGSFSSAYSDAIFAAQNYCPIADIENADMAYAWWWVDLVDEGGVYNGKITAFEKRLQELMANEYINYINSLDLKDEKGNSLTLTGLRSGTYYDAILKNLSDALNKYVEIGAISVEHKYDNSSSWIKHDEEIDRYEVTDLKGFMIGTGLVKKRNKAIPGFDAKDKSAENNAFGRIDQDKVHFSQVIGMILKQNYTELSRLEGFNKEVVDSYIEDTVDGEDATYISAQTLLLNATHILLGKNNIKPVNPVKYYRNRSGTADQHTFFGIGYNIMLAAQQLGIKTDYSLVWDMEHGNNEGESTGTFIDWVNKICEENMITENNEEENQNEN